MEATAPRTFTKGDRVTPDPTAPGIPTATLGQTYIVTKVNPKNIRADAENGGRGISFPASMLLPANEATTTATLQPFERVEFFVCGEIVTLKRPPKGYTDASPFIVMKDNGEKVNVAPLGGAEDRYWRYPKRGDGIVRRDIAWLKGQG